MSRPSGGGQRLRPRGAPACSAGLRELRTPWQAASVPPGKGWAGCLSNESVPDKRQGGWVQRLPGSPVGRRRGEERVQACPGLMKPLAVRRLQEQQQELGLVSSGG